MMTRRLVGRLGGWVGPPESLREGPVQEAGWKVGLGLGAVLPGVWDGQGDVVFAFDLGVVREWQAL